MMTNSHASDSLAALQSRDRHGRTRAGVTVKAPQCWAAAPGRRGPGHRDRDGLGGPSGASLSLARPDSVTPTG